MLKSRMTIDGVPVFINEENEIDIDATLDGFIVRLQDQTPAILRMVRQDREAAEWKEKMKAKIADFQLAVKKERR